MKKEKNPLGHPVSATKFGKCTILIKKTRKPFTRRLTSHLMREDDLIPWYNGTGIPSPTDGQVDMADNITFPQIRCVRSKDHISNENYIQIKKKLVHLLFIFAIFSSWGHTNHRHTADYFSQNLYVHMRFTWVAVLILFSTFLWRINKTLCLILTLLVT